MELSKLSRRPLSPRARVAGDQRIVALLRDGEDSGARALARVVGLDEHVLGDQPLDEISAQISEALGVALSLVLVARGARFGGERMAGLGLLHEADEVAL